MKQKRSKMLGLTWSPHALRPFDKGLEAGVPQHHRPDPLVVHVEEGQRALVLAVLAHVALAQGREVEVVAGPGLEEDVAAVGRVGEEGEVLGVPEHGLVQVVAVALGVLGEDEGEVVDLPEHGDDGGVAVPQAGAVDLGLLRELDRQRLDTATEGPDAEKKGEIVEKKFDRTCCGYYLCSLKHTVSELKVNGTYLRDMKIGRT